MIIAIIIFFDLIDIYFFEISGKFVTIFLGRYGNVVTRQDWKRIKKNNKDIYKEIWNKNNIGRCYYVLRTLACLLEDSKIMYCSVTLKMGKKAGHAVVVKNNCIYDTNEREHFDYEEYLSENKAEVYKIFEKDIYSKPNFLKDVEKDFKIWCNERDAYF